MYFELFRSIWEAEPKRWGLAEKLSNRKKETADAKEKAFHKHLQQLEKQVEKLDAKGRNKDEDQLNFVGLGKFYFCFFYFIL